jgi:hypothetical protein
MSFRARGKELARKNYDYGVLRRKTNFWRSMFFQEGAHLISYLSSITYSPI